MSDEIERVVVRYETGIPLEVATFADSLKAVSAEYVRFLPDTGCVLVVESIGEGSVVAVMKGAAKAAIAMADPTGGALVPFALEAAAPFAGHWSGVLEALANYGRDAGADRDLRRVDKSTLKAAKAFVQPAIEGNPIQVYGERNKVIQNNFYIDPSTGGDIVRHANHMLAAMPGEEQRFENEPMALYQLRDARAGDLGFIDRFERRPRRLTFANDAVKEAILRGEARPFDVFFFVSGVARTARGEIASYHIERIDGVTEKDAA